MAEPVFEPKDVLLTNLIWSLGDIMYILMDDNLESLRKKRLHLRHATKHRFGQALEQYSKSKELFLKFTQDIRELNPDQVEQFVQDSDLIRNFLLLLTDKLIGRPKNIKKAWEYLHSLESDNVLQIPKELEL